MLVIPGLRERVIEKLLRLGQVPRLGRVAFQDQQQLNFPLLSDFNKEASRAYETIYEDWIMEMKGVSKRSAFVIDKEGVVRYAEVLENAGLEPNYEAIDATLAQLN